jgi:hypothetical protein
MPPDPTRAPQAMLSGSCEFYGDMEAHEPVDCRLADVLAQLLATLEGESARAEEQGGGGAAAASTGPSAAAVQTEEPNGGGGGAGGGTPFMYLAQQSLHGPGELTGGHGRRSRLPPVPEHTHGNSLRSPRLPTTSATQAWRRCWMMSPCRTSSRAAASARPTCG